MNTTSLSVTDVSSFVGFNHVNHFIQSYLRNTKINKFGMDTDPNIIADAGYNMLIKRDHIEETFSVEAVSAPENG
ncbi:hypothetical protein H70357_13315 [Paenibacillus sp. FSL H7-0357]|nr:hypothetical protein H70357_13315 [Paenibacillus sp. FSL H7-0357]